MTTSSATQNQDTGTALLAMLRDEGWDDAAFELLMHPESMVLRNAALANVRSRTKTEKDQT